MRLSALKTPTGRRVRPSTLRAAAQTIRQAPEREYPGWDWHPLEGFRILEAIRHGLHDRINQRGGLRVGTARATALETSWRRDAQRIADYRRSRIVSPGSGLETGAARRAAPDVHARLIEVMA